MLAEPAALARPEADGAAPPVARGWRLPLVPLGIMLLYLFIVRRFGAFDAL